MNAFFPFLYVGLRKIIKDIFKLVGEKKFGGEKTAKNLGISNFNPENVSVLLEKN